MPPSYVQAQNTNDFTIQSFEADYYLGRDSEGRSTLKTVEKIIAIFPDYDQNHGLERAIPKTYDGHSTSLRVQSVTDEQGRALNYSDRTSNDNLVLRIGDADTYVHGSNTYVITYTQRDATRFFDTTNADEFYWDVNGTQWGQSMGRVTARVHVAAGLGDALSNKISCYQGREGDTAACPLARSSENGETIFTANAENLNPGENVTVAIGFAPHTFSVYQQSAQEKLFATLFGVWGLLLVVGSVIAAIILVWVIIVRRRVMNRVKGRPSITPEYLPPKGTSVLLSGEVLRNSTSDITAQLIDLAVRHYVKIYQTREKALFKSAEYELSLEKPIDDLHSEEQALIKNLFGGQAPKPGTRFAMKSLQSNYKLGKKLLASRKKLREDARGTYGLYERAEVEARRFKTLGTTMMIIGVITLSPVVVIVAIITLTVAHTLWPLTQKGVELRDYLSGLSEYIRVAETERINMLQSPEGAEKVGEIVDNGNTTQLVKLYERVLPYAILFGIEKEWTKQLGAYYEARGAQPDWYSGNGAFNAVVFSSAINGFTSQASSYSSATSSASGGSDGGGSSGGGGGGGGGGGW